MPSPALRVVHTCHNSSPRSTEALPVCSSLAVLPTLLIALLTFRISVHLCQHLQDIMEAAQPVLDLLCCGVLNGLYCNAGRHRGEVTKSIIAAKTRVKDPDSARALEAELLEAVEYVELNASMAMADLLLVRLTTWVLFPLPSQHP